MSSELSCIDTTFSPATGTPITAPAQEASRTADLQIRIERTIQFMRDNLAKPVQAATLAAKASMSLSHYFALFRRITGHTPIDYLIQLRMDRARELLKSTDLSVKEVAAALGYEDAFYFSRAFKAVNSIPPTRYRAGTRLNDNAKRRLTTLKEVHQTLLPSTSKNQT